MCCESVCVEGFFCEKFGTAPLCGTLNTKMYGDTPDIDFRRVSIRKVSVKFQAKCHYKNVWNFLP